MTNVQKAAKALREANIELRNVQNERYPNHFAIVRLSDRIWDLKALYKMHMRIAGLEEV